MACALVAAGITSCSKDSASTTESGKSTKSVSITLANVTSTRSAAAEPISDGTTIGITNFQVFFADNTGKLHLGKDADGSDAEHYFDNLSSGSISPATFHFLPAAVEKVIILCNLDSKIDVENGVTATSALEKTLSIANEQNLDVTNNHLSLYGESGLSLKGTNSHGGNLYAATVNVLPRIARIEISKFGCTFESPSSYETITVNQVALNNYYSEASLTTGQASGTLVNTVLDEGSIWPYFEGLGSGWFNDKVTFALTPALPGAENVKLAYQFFPSASAYPQLAVRLTAHATGTDTPLYLLTSGFASGSGHVSTFEAGKIYQVDFTFAETSLEHPEKCVEVTVTPKQWEVVAVTPEF